MRSTTPPAAENASNPALKRLSMATRPVSLEVERAAAPTPPSKRVSTVRSSPLRKGGKAGQTLIDQHTDLLQLIAQKERRVNDLKQELRQEEAALEELKSRWAVVLSTSRSAATPYRRTHTQSSHSLSLSTSTAASSSLATVDEPAGLDPPSGPGSGIEKILTGLAKHTEDYISPEVLEGGKKFLDTLWKTVGAAATGDVPMENGHGSQNRRSLSIIPPDQTRRESWGHLRSSFDLSGLQSMISPWSSTASSALSSSSSHPQLYHPDPSPLSRKTANSSAPSSLTSQSTPRPPRFSPNSTAIEETTEQRSV
ncbi:hypothetical protein L204_100976 [Cryptococcus depauperatus]